MVLRFINLLVLVRNMVKQINVRLVTVQICITNLIKKKGKCLNGTRFIPVKMLDVAGLVPGASEGRVIISNPSISNSNRVSVTSFSTIYGTLTSFFTLSTLPVVPMKKEKKRPVTILFVTSIGFKTKFTGTCAHLPFLTLYSWIFNNLWRKWGSTVRRHINTSKNHT